MSNILKDIQFTKKEICLYVILISLFLILAIFKPVMIAIVNGRSMEPTLVNKDILVMFKRSKISNGDIVIVHSPENWHNGDKLLIKRVLAKPGDKLEIVSGKIYVNDRYVMDVNEYYPKIKDTELQLKDTYFVKGDNTGNSQDSLFHYYIADTDFLVSKDEVMYSINGGDYKWEATK